MHKAPLIFFQFLVILTSSAQKNLAEFEGNLVFKESYFFYRVTRASYDTMTTFSNYEIDKTIKIEQSAAFSNFHSEEINYVSLNFCKLKDSLFYKYADPFDKDHDTTFIKLFPLAFKDTIESVFCFKLIMDTLRGTDPKRTVTISTECHGDDDEIKTYRTRDTVLKFKDYTLQCYRFEQKEPLRSHNGKFFTRIILVDKLSLIPVDVKEYNFHTPGTTRWRNYYQGKNFLTYHQKLIGIE